MAKTTNKKNSKPQNNSSFGNGKNKNGKRKFFNPLYIYVFIFAGLFLYMFMSGTNVNVVEIDNTQFKQMVEDKEIDHVEYVRRGERVNVFLKKDALDDKVHEKVKENVDGPQYALPAGDFQVFSNELNDIRDKAIQKRLAKDSTLVETDIMDEYDFPVKQDNTKNWGVDLIFWILPLALIFMLFSFSMRRMGGGGGGNVFNIGKSRAQEFDEKSGQLVTFKDVAGLEGAKFEIEEVVDFLKNPKKYTVLGGKIPKGVLLVGPPGTGKTLLAKAVAGEAKVPFFSLSGSDFVEMFVGVGASRVRDLFKTAKEKAPCIIFIDEIDAIGRARGKSAISNANDERESTLNQLLTEMDGFDGNNGVIILAATNRPETLDPALTRPGRFDRRVPVELPDLKGREAILAVHAKKIKTEPDIDFTRVARMASGASGAELANIVNEAALRAVRAGKSAVSQEDLEESIEVVIAGYQKKNAILTDKEKKVVAYHEIGHALVAAKQSNSAPVQKITIVPRTSGALGYTMQVDEGNHYLMTKEEMENKIATYTGGRAAEEVAIGSITTGASNDIEQATKLARAMIARYGMSEEFGMVALETVSNHYLGGDASLACSAQTQTEIDKKVIELVKTQYDKARAIILENRDKLDELSRHLYVNETITGEEFMNILNS